MGVTLRTEGHVAIFMLDRPAAMNAINREMSEEMEKCLAQFEEDDSLWIGVIASAHEKVFCAGADLKAISRGQNVSTPLGGFAGITTYPRTKPLIAAVDGAALAGGFEIVLSCDLVVASTKARFGVPEVKRSLIAAAGGLFRLPRKVPHAIAMEMLLTGAPKSAEEMAKYGLVNRLVAPGAALTAALELAKEITANAPLAVRASKKVVDSTRLSAEDEGFKISLTAFGELARTPDFREGPMAFIQKRAPVWTGKAKL